MINTNIIEPGSIVEFIMEGVCVIEEVIDIIGSQYCNISKGVLWNFTNGSNANLSTDDMTRIAQMVKKHAIHKKTAYVGSADLEFGILRMYETYAVIQSVPPVMKVFRDRTDAIKWLNELS
jgi:hypothetical protein